MFNMFNLFRARRESEVEIVRDHDHLLERMGHIIRTNLPKLDALGDDHGATDLALLEQIEDLLGPLIGPSGIDDKLWFQSADFYGDGTLKLKPGAFPRDAIPALQSLLVQEHSSFGILCWAPQAAEGQPGDKEGVVIFRGTATYTAFGERLRTCLTIRCSRCGFGSMRWGQVLHHDISARVFIEPYQISELT